MAAVQASPLPPHLPQKPLNTYLNNLPTTVFSVMTELAIKHQSVNLGQGFPDDEGPESMKQIVGESSRDRHNQYPPTGGTAPIATSLEGRLYQASWLKDRAWLHDLGGRDGEKSHLLAERVQLASICSAGDSGRLLVPTLLAVAATAVDSDCTAVWCLEECQALLAHSLNQMPSYGG